MDAEKFVLSMLVSNEAGVLTRVSGLFGRRGYNIDSLSVGETDDPSISRITILTSGDECVREQTLRQLEKLHDVKVVTVMDPANTVLRELMLIKVRAGLATRSQILETVNVFRGKIVDLAPESATVEITGEKSKLDALILCLEPYGITELCRTGVTAIGRGEYKLQNNNEECV